MTDFSEIIEESRLAGIELAKAAPETTKAFSALLQTATRDGVLSHKTKELIAFALGVAARCDGCLAHHAAALVKAGATREEVVETLGVAIAMGGGPSKVYADLALKVYDQAAPGGVT